MIVPEEIFQLVERFDRNRDAYLSGQYNETQLRREFLDPFFTALGWDVDNRQGYAEAYKDVVHEDAIKVGGATKAPDYCFRIGGTRKFFVEAKKPSVNLKDEVSPAFQLRRYAWSAKLPLSILTDFEEFAVYDCRVRPEKTDKASSARVLYLTCRDYTEKWDAIASVFSRDAVLKGSFDKYAEKGKHKKGTAEVDDAFLAEIESWRDMLARHIALRNPRLSQRELNFSVQRTIDRIIFLRICEDRGIEEYGRLMSLLNGANVYRRLFQIFRNADERYNSGLFHFEKEKERHELPDDLTPALDLDDKVLKDMLRRLYYPESPYEFSVLPADILGQVYEQFLGKVIRLTPGHRAVVEEKREVRKAGGVYYTPTYIVEYIVENTVGVLVGSRNDAPEEGGSRTASANITPKEVSKIRILDPACGSGSFLLGAYQYLLDWHRDWFVNNDPQKWATGRNPTLYQAQGGDWRLTTVERKRILLNNIYGVDIDSQAVEVTKLSLLLKVLEGENDQTLERQLRFFHERALPDLGDNIKCGNSLIGPDFYEQQSILDDEERYRINVFDWNAEFPRIMKAGGFDAVIGNPPYGADYNEIDKEYFQAHYAYKKGKPETYIFFMEKGYALLKRGGVLGYITPNAWLTNHYGVQLRRFLFENAVLRDIADLEPLRVFAAAVVDTAITILSKESMIYKNNVYVKVWRGIKGRGIIEEFKIDQRRWLCDKEAIINLQANPVELDLLTRMDSSLQVLDSIVDYSQGVIPYKTKQEGVVNKYISGQALGAEWIPLLENASQVRRYEIDKPAAFIKYGRWLWCAREPKYFSEPKILFHRVRKKLPRQLVGCIDTSGVINRHSLSNLILRSGNKPLTLHAVLGLFNSTLANWWFVKKYGVLMEVGGFKIGRLPLPAAWQSSVAQLGGLVIQIMNLHSQLPNLKTDHEKTALQRQIEAVDRQIDKLVYDLYGLTEKEIRIVEG